MAFRDIGDTNQFQIKDFPDADKITNHEDQIIEFLDTLTAYGGDDLPEDVLGALDQCLNLKNLVFPPRSLRIR